VTARLPVRTLFRVTLALVVASCLLFLYASAAHAQEEQPPSGELAQTTGNVYFYLDGVLAPVSREIAAGGQTIEFAVLEVLKGPSEEEKAAGYVTYIPEGVKMLYSSIKQDRTEYSVNLSREILELAGDREAAVRALAQLFMTIREVSHIQNVKATVAAEESGAPPLDAFEVLGITPEEVEAEITGEPVAGEGKGFSPLLAIGIPVLCLLAAGVAVFLLRRRKSEGAEKGERRRPFWRRKKAARSRVAGFAKRPGSMKVGRRERRSSGRKRKNDTRKGRKKTGEKGR